MDLKSVIRSIPDFPRKGIIFRDITTVLNDSAAFRFAVDAMTEKLEGVEFDAIVAPESRGFIFGAALAYNMGKAFVPARKPGKLPYNTIRQDYALEYGEDAVEIHSDAVSRGRRAVIVDDLLATGGTCSAIADLLNGAGCKTAAAVFLIELAALGGRHRLDGLDVRSVVVY
ncbi:MAG: adenine phosphoribosyltransferase [Clostridiales bacterium]|jgi:adenine phosphoribosyltransferase|nr:adenine phosphoribosyltransferase [Clostridiales bacterium]